MENKWLTIHDIHEMMWGYDSDKLWTGMVYYFCERGKLTDEEAFKECEEILLWLLERISEKSWVDWDRGLRSYIYNASD